MTSVFVNVHSFQEVCLHYLSCFIALQSVSQMGLLFSGNIYLLPGQIHSTEVQQRHPVPVVGQCTGLVVHSVFHTLGSHLHDLQFERHSRHATAGTHVRFQERLLQLISHLQLTTTCFSLCQRFSTLCTPAEELSLNGPEKKALELSDLTTCPDTIVS